MKMNWILGRLRNKVLTFVLVLVVSAILGTTFFTARSFVRDKQDYVLELSSIATPNVAAAISNRLDSIYGQLVVFDEILKERNRESGPADILQTAFRKLIGVERLDIFDSQGKLASIHNLDAPGGVESGSYALDETKVWSSPVYRDRGVHLLSSKGSSKNNSLVFSAPVGGHLYLAVLRKDLFADYVESSRALSAVWVTENGQVILGGAAATPDFERVVKEMLSALQGREKQSAVAKELTLPSGEKYLAAVSPVSGTRASAVVSMVPSIQASRMARQMFRNLTPFIVLISVLAIALGIIFSARIVKPIEDLTEATSRIAEGDWKVSFRSRTTDEIGRLIKAFSKMGGELEKREIALREANKALVRNEILSSLGKFSAGLAHEVKNPLNSILGFAQLLEKKMSPPPDETIGKYLRFIMDETRRADRIITDLLTFARQRPPTLSRVKVDELLQRASQLFVPQAEAAKVRLVKEITSGISAADLDGEQIYQVLLNLMTNAIHAMHENAEGAPRILTLRSREDREHVILEISDTGHGISEENRNRIFEPFFTTKGVGKGTGLGLAMCHGIIQQHLGTIEVTSKVGAGTTFSIFLPKAPPSATGLGS